MRIFLKATGVRKYRFSGCGKLLVQSLKSFQMLLVHIYMCTGFGKPLKLAQILHNISSTFRKPIDNSINGLSVTLL
jgi:hypothetical protein